MNLIERKKHQHTHAYDNLLTLRATSAAQRWSVRGAVLQGEPHIVGINELWVDFPASGHVLLAMHHDRPGMIGRVGTLLGNAVRSGPMELPAHLEVRAILGNVELDLREASFGAFTEISIKSVLGNVEITLPMGVRVENDGDGILGSCECHVAAGSMPMVGTSPVVRLTGRSVLGLSLIHISEPTRPD